MFEGFISFEFLSAIMKAKAHIEAMSEYSPPIEGRSCYEDRLDFNESLLGPAPQVIDSIKDFMDSKMVGVYPEYGGLEERIASFYGIESGKAMACNGSDKAIDTIIRTYVEAGQKVIIPSPSFAMFYQYAGIEGAKTIEVQYENDMSFPIDGVVDAIDADTALIIICNPNNPTGTKAEKKHIDDIIEASDGIPVYIDEAYFEFMGETSLGLIAQHDNLIISRSFSKAFGLASLRAGCILSQEENIRQMLKVRGPYDVNMAAKVGIMASFDNYGRIRDYCSHVMCESKPYLEKELKRMGVEFFPSHANFLLVRFGQEVKSICERLKDRGILIRDRSSHPLLSGCARISLGKVEHSKRLVAALEEIL